VHSVRKPWWQQATALVTVTTGGVITGFNFVPGAAATMTSPTSVPLHLLALEQAGQPGAAMNARAVGGDSADSATGDALLRSAIVNVAKYYLQLASTRSPAQMETLIWDNTSVNGADHGPSCAAFASLTLELAAQAVGQQSWVSGGTSYPWPLPAWADVRVDTNPASPAITSVTADAQAHDRWHPADDGYRPQPGDWVVFAHHVEVVTRYSGGVLDTIGADSLPDLTVNAHSYSDSLAANGVAGFVDNGHLAAASFDTTTAAPARAVTSPGDTADEKSGTGSSTSSSPSVGRTATSSPSEAGSTAASPSQAGRNADPAVASPGGQPVIPGLGQPTPVTGTATTGTGHRGGGSTAAASPPRAAATAAHAAAVVPGVIQPPPAGGAPDSSTGSGTQALDGAGSTARNPGAAIPGSEPMASATSGSAAIPGASPAAVAPTAHPSTTPTTAPTPAAAPTGPVDAPTSAPSPSPGSTSPSATVTPSATATPTSRASSAAATPGHYRQYAAPAQPTPGTRAQQAFISLIAPGAAAAQQRWGVPAAVTIAQAIDESAWGNSQLAARYHNLFGIKGSGPAGSVALPTSEFYNGQWVTIDAQFRVYHNVAESIADHAELLATSGYYQRAMADRAVPDAFANDLTGVYATDPDYGANLIAIMKLYNLYRFEGPTQPAQSVQPQAAPATPAPAASQSTASQSTAAQRAATHPAATHPATNHAQAAGGTSAEGHPGGGQAAIPGLGSPALAPATGQAAAGSEAVHPAQPTAPIPGVVAPTGLTSSSSPAPARTAADQARGGAAVPGLAAPAATSYRPQPAAAATTAARYQPQFTTAMTTAYFANAKGPLGHGEHLYRDVARQTGIRWELLAACDWMQCKAHPRYSPVRGEKIGALNSDGTSYTTKSAALGQCASDLIELAGAVYGIDLTAKRPLSVRALADVFAAFRWGALLRRHGVSAMEFPYSVAGLTAQHHKMHWPVIDDPDVPDRPGARFREPFGAVPVVLSLDYPATVLTDRKRRQPPCSGSFPGSAAGPTRAARPLTPVSRSPCSSQTASSRADASSSGALTARSATARTIPRS
jgi:flagellum-specific peptidoglycan hydrolase FlgJ